MLPRVFEINHKHSTCSHRGRSGVAENIQLKMPWNIQSLDLQDSHPVPPTKKDSNSTLCNSGFSKPPFSWTRTEKNKKTHISICLPPSERKQTTSTEAPSSPSRVLFFARLCPGRQELPKVQGWMRTKSVSLGGPLMSHSEVESYWDSASFVNFPEVKICEKFAKYGTRLGNWWPVANKEILQIISWMTFYKSPWEENLEERR